MPPLSNRPRYAARLNAFKIGLPGKPGVADMIARAGQVAGHNPALDIAIEYKPNEPRCFALMPDIGTTLLATREAARPNLGVTLDFAHVLYADEIPAQSANLVARHSRLLGVHLNDGYASAMMV